MRARATIMNKGNMIVASSRAKQMVKIQLERAKEIEGDLRKTERLEKHECKACFYVYRPRVGGAAMTDRDCMCCHETQGYSSTATDALCMSCAKEHSLCKHCGGDLDMRERRREWPEPKSKND